MPSCTTTLVLQQNGSYVCFVNAHLLPQRSRGVGQRDGEGRGGVGSIAATAADKTGVRLKVIDEIFKPRDEGGHARGVENVTRRRRLNLKYLRPAAGVMLQLQQRSACPQQRSACPLLKRVRWCVCVCVCVCVCL